jgi:6-phosphogluconolactonase
MMTPRVAALVASGALVVAGCAGSSNDSGSLGPVTYAVGGTVSGLSGSGLRLHDDRAGDVAVVADGAFTFPTRLASGTPFLVSVSSQPADTGEHCLVMNAGGSGTIANADLSSVKVSCATVGRLALVADQAANGIGAYSIDPTTGALSVVAGSPYPVEIPKLDYVLSMGAGSTGNYVYAMNWYPGYVPANGAERVRGFSVGATGALSALASSPYGLPAFASVVFDSVLAVDTPGAFAYLVRTSDHLPGSEAIGEILAIRINSADGSLTATGTASFDAGAFPSPAAFATVGGFLYVGCVTGLWAYTRDAANGALAPVAGNPVPVLIQPASLAAVPGAAYLYAAAPPGNSVIAAFQINATTGALVPITGSPFGAFDGSNSMAVDPSGSFLYAMATQAGTHAGLIAAYKIDAATGAITAITGSPFATGVLSPTHLATDPSGKFVALVGTGASGGALAVLTVDSVSGTLTPVSGSPFAIAAADAKALAIVQ